MRSYRTEAAERVRFCDGTGWKERNRERRYMEEREKALLVGVDTGEDEDFNRSMKELGELACACGMKVAGAVTQRMENIHKAY